MSFCAVSGGEEKYARPVVIQAAEPHNFTLAGECSDGETVPHGLAERGEVRNNAMKFLRSGEMPSKAGDGLIK